ncbi:MAG: lycopene cyclase domain-containing protein [Bacteroidetes bacterium]|nr:lycopene cyclase domain-containing protein [Bacteroidota bacterium]
MKEYTVLAVLSVGLALLLDRWLHTMLVRKGTFWIAMGIMFLFKIPSNGYLTGRPIVLYNADHFLGIRLWTIPVEDFLFGFGLITVTLVLWEYFVTKSRAA